LNIVIHFIDDKSLYIQNVIERKVNTHDYLIRVKQSDEQKEFKFKTSEIKSVDVLV